MFGVGHENKSHLDMENSNENPIRRLPAFESRVLEAMEFGFGFLAMSKKCTEIQEIEGKSITWESKIYMREKEKQRRIPWFVLPEEGDCRERTSIHVGNGKRSEENDILCFWKKRF